MVGHVNNHQNEKRSRDARQGTRGDQEHDNCYTASQIVVGVCFASKALSWADTEATSVQLGTDVVTNPEASRSSIPREKQTQDCESSHTSVVKLCE